MKVTAALSAAAVALAATPALAQEPGRIQVKAFATYVGPDGEITDLRVNRIPVPAGSDTKARDAVVPTVAVEYFLTPQISVETICCVTQHDVRGAGAINGAKLINNAEIIPATVTLKYHFPLDGGIKPYVGAGPAYFMIFGEGLGGSARALGATNVGLSSELGAAVQVGVDIPLPNQSVALSLDAKRYFVDTVATFRSGSNVVLESKHKLDPWVLSAGLAWRF